MRKRSPAVRLVSALAMATACLVPGLALAGAQEGAAATPVQLQRKAPVGAPNVVIVLLDDVGFGAASTFGGPVATPTLDSLAREGLRYNRFHTTAMCSPTRASLLTGRNPHATGVGAIINVADPRPGYNGFHGKDTALFAEVLRQNGYATAAFGKWHQTADWETSQSGPFDRWPTSEGFERFYGFQAAETDQFEPSLYDGTTPILRPARNDYTLTQDLVDHSISWIREQRSFAPDKPFFLYLATGATHSPLQVPKVWSDRYTGKFHGGWDEQRRETWQRQLASGTIPNGTTLTPRPDGLLPWAQLNPSQKKAAERFMEVYAGFLEQTDAEVGRLVAELKRSGEFQNTIFIYIVGDNGASGEGEHFGSVNQMKTAQGIPETDADRLARLPDIGTASAEAAYNSEWGWAMNSPFQYVKSVASHLGGTRNPMVVSWPKRITDHGGMRSQFSHVNDIAPTILEAIGVVMPETVNGVPQKPMDGTSLVYSFDNAGAPERHRTQYFEMYGNRAIYHDGWMASAMHGKPSWSLVPVIDPRPFSEDKWELYDLANDYSQGNDLATAQPGRLKEMQDLFMAEAARNNVLPLAPPRATSGTLPSLATGRTHFTFYPGTTVVPEKMLRGMLGRSWTLTAALTIAGDTRGVIAANGGAPAGWAFYLDNQRRPVFTYRSFDVEQATLSAPPLAAGDNAMKVDFDYDGGGRGKGGILTLTVNGKKASTARLSITPSLLFSLSETFGVGVDTGSPAVAYPAGSPVGNQFRGGAIGQVDIDLR